MPLVSYLCSKVKSFQRVLLPTEIAVDGSAITVVTFYAHVNPKNRCMHFLLYTWWITACSYVTEINYQYYKLAKFNQNQNSHFLKKKNWWLSSSNGRLVQIALHLGCFGPQIIIWINYPYRWLKLMTFIWSCRLKEFSFGLLEGITLYTLPSLQIYLGVWCA